MNKAMSTTPSETPRTDAANKWLRENPQPIWECVTVTASAQLESELASAQAEIGKWKECAQVAIDDLRNVHHGEMNRWPTAAQYKSIALYAALPTGRGNRVFPIIFVDKLCLFR